MRAVHAATLLLSSFALAHPWSAPGPKTPSDGYPSPNMDQLKEISRRADGTLSNAPPPPKLGDSSKTAFQALAFGEEFEKAYFQSLLTNITNNVPGYKARSRFSKKELTKMLSTVVAQEELHAINAINVLKHFNVTAPMPCKYHFPVNNLQDAFALAESFTMLVVGTLQDVSQTLAQNGDNGVVRAIASVIGQEGEQGGFYRTLLGRVPSEKPFLTTSVGAFAYSYIYNNFVVPGSCPFDLSMINLPIFAKLDVKDRTMGMDVKAMDQKLTFTADVGAVKGAEKFVGGKGDGLFLTYFSGQLLPISEPITNVKWNKGRITFDAFFPFEENVMQGLSVAALTTANNFSSPLMVPGATIAAPAIIQVNDKL
ncbi:late sexual development [Fusarium albosuccineum]|uniref:Late sexual development n=1 Tax=Fusarium albosuccineum TaxID=1237068 RepID=A0A8H4LDG8_9HYPO|nr:late sexual development [Fusarium albosuccineum]